MWRHTASHLGSCHPLDCLLALCLCQLTLSLSCRALAQHTSAASHLHLLLCWPALSQTQVEAEGCAAAILRLMCGGPCPLFSTPVRIVISDNDGSAYFIYVDAGQCAASYDWARLPPAEAEKMAKRLLTCLLVGADVYQSVVSGTGAAATALGWQCSNDAMPAHPLLVTHDAAAGSCPAADGTGEPLAGCVKVVLLLALQALLVLTWAPACCCCPCHPCRCLTCSLLSWVASTATGTSSLRTSAFSLLRMAACTSG